MSHCPAVRILKIEAGLAILSASWMSSLMFVTGVSAGDAQLDAMRSAAIQDANAVWTVIEKLYSPIVASMPVDYEELRYDLKAGPVGLIKGNIWETIRREKVGARDVYHIHRAVKIGSRLWEEDSIIDARSWLPWRHTRKIQRPNKETHVKNILWDHLGMRLFSEKYTVKNGKRVGVFRRQEWQLGKDVPADAMDPLGVVLAYRDKCNRQGKAIAWTVPVFDADCDLYACSFQPRSVESVEGAAPAGESRVATVALRWKSRSPGAKNKTVMYTLALDKQSAPLRYSGARYGIKWLTTLRKRDVKKAPSKTVPDNR